MARHFKIDDVLSDEHRQEFERFARLNRTTIDELGEWLTGHGYRISRGAVHNWKKDFDKTLDGVRQSAELAASFAQVAKENGAAGLADATWARFQQILMEKLFEIGADDESPTPGDLMKIGVAMKSAIGAKQQIEELRDSYEKKQRDALAAAEKIKQAGGGADAVINEVREILGIKTQAA